MFLQSAIRIPHSAISVLRHARINLVRPGGNAALQVYEASAEAGARQRLNCLCASDAALAVNDRLAPLFNLRLPVDDLPERDEFRCGDARDLVLVRLAHVYDLNTLAAVEPLFQLRRTDLFHLSRLLRFVRLRRRRAQSAELLVVNQLAYRRRLPAHGARRVFPQLQLAEAKLPRVEQEQTIDERVASAEYELDRLVRLYRADDAGQHAEHSAFGARRDEAGRRRLWIKATVARAPRGPENARLPLEAKDRAVDVRLAREHARVVDQIACREVVCAVNDNVVIAYEFQRIVARQTRLVSLYLHVRVDVAQTVARRLDLGPPNVLRAVHDLSLQVRRVNHVEVNDAERADARRRKVHAPGHTKSPSPDRQNARGLQTPLPLHADFGHDEVTAVARNLFVRERRERGRVPFDRRRGSTLYR